jgi:hypothetical protein
MRGSIISRAGDCLGSNILRCEICRYRKIEPIVGFFVILNPVLTVSERNPKFVLC